MNGEPLPFLNGFPLRLVVPGYYGTYWVKHLSEITVIESIYDGFWMKTAYRIPDNACACVEPGTAPKATIPINKFNTRSFITSLANGAKVKAGQPITIKGFAFDGGEGIKEVELSIDGGKTWQQAKLGKDFGKYSFREWQLAAMLLAGPHELMVRATNNAGATQPAAATWNPAGYMRNIIETTAVTAG
jgi:sulfite dehydrogenase (cytochrome) subunit A